MGTVLECAAPGQALFACGIQPGCDPFAKRPGVNRGAAVSLCPNEGRTTTQCGATAEVEDGMMDA